MKSITVVKNLKGKVVILRTDFNVPIKNGKVVDDFRIRVALPTIKFLRKSGASIVIISHSDLNDDTQTLAPVARELAKHIKIRFVKETLPQELSLKDGEIVLLENIRREKGEKKNDIKLAKALASLGNLYVNDAFPVSHREHASIVGIPKFLPSYAGLQMEKEIAHLSKLIKKPAKPFLVIIGGAKFDTKLPLIKRFLKNADHVFVGGALANDFLKLAGFEVGKSLVEEGYDLKSLLKNKKILLPIDVVVMRGGKALSCLLEEVESGDVIIDSGKNTTKLLSKIVANSKTVLWNGPLGKYESPHGKEASLSVLKALTKNRKCFSVIGGGDITAVSTPAIEKKLSFVSTGGGATLEFLATGTLPGIKALK
jgi:phosphoglycerate kinase